MGEPAMCRTAMARDLSCRAVAPRGRMGADAASAGPGICISGALPPGRASAAKEATMFPTGVLRTVDQAAEGGSRGG